MVLESDGVEVHFHTLHVRPRHNRLELVNWVSSGQQAVILSVDTEEKFAIADVNKHPVITCTSWITPT